MVIAPALPPLYQIREKKTLSFDISTQSIIKSTNSDHCKVILIFNFEINCRNGVNSAFKMFEFMFDAD